MYNVIDHMQMRECVYQMAAARYSINNNSMPYNRW